MSTSVLIWHYVLFTMSTWKKNCSDCNVKYLAALLHIQYVNDFFMMLRVIFVLGDEHKSHKYLILMSYSSCPCTPGDKASLILSFLA